jgi:hypothetical protein
MRAANPEINGSRLRSGIIALAAALLVCVALQACLKRGPSDADLVAILMKVQSERPTGAPEAIEILAYQCRLMAHGQSYECDVEFVQTRDGAPGLPRRAYLIVNQADAGWRLISHEPRS